MLLQYGKGNDLQGGLLSGLQPNWWRHAVVVGLLPARSTDTPVVPWT